MKNINLLGFILLLPFGILAQLRNLTEPKRLEIGINTSAEESLPVISKDGNEIYFVRTFDENNIGGVNDQDIWKSVKNEQGKWTTAVNFEELNNDEHNGVVALGDSKAYLLNSYAGKKDNSKGISFAGIKNDGSFEKPNKISINGLSVHSENVGFAVSGDEKTIVISMKSENSSNGDDLFISKLIDGIWTKPLNMGNQINSIENEISPFLSQNGDTLYFSSNGFPGYGNYDIFFSVRKGALNEWSAPLNLGDKINSEDFDAYFVKHKNQFYWSSNRNAKDADIYFAEILTPPVLTVNITKNDVTIFKGNDGSINLDLVSGVAPYQYEWSNGGRVEDQYKLRKGTYQVKITDAIGQTIYKTVQIDEPQPELKKSFRLPEVLFVFDSWEFATVNYDDSLALVADLLKENSGMVIELISHTDARGDEKANQKLSENRAKAVYTYLVEKKGIDPRRMIPVGKGEIEPTKIFESKTNTFIDLTEAYIEQFKISDKGHYEYLHQLNRRMEGKIVSLDFDPIKATPAPKSYLLQH
jgi:outer membrane protein OmpA-like peptidoglycan-associated protein